jgi:hypothetical protein
MRDPFARAQVMHHGRPQSTGPAPAGVGVGPGAPPATAAPMAPSPTTAQAVPPQMNFLHMSKAMGLGHMKLDKNPATARTQLIQHLQKHFGQNYMGNPQAQQLLEAFNQHSTGAAPGGADTAMAANLKALLG